MTQHTKTPLVLSENINDTVDAPFIEYCIETAGGEIVTFLRDKELAAFIVRAVNSHDALVQKLEKALSLIVAMDDYIVKNTPDTCADANELGCHANDIGAEITGLIALAKGEQTARRIRNSLSGVNEQLGIILLDKIENRAESDPAFNSHYQTWLVDGGTVLLRDELAGPFKNDGVFRSIEPERFDPWHDAWTTLDSAHLKVS